MEPAEAVLHRRWAYRVSDLPEWLPWLAQMRRRSHFFTCNLPLMRFGLLLLACGRPIV